MYKTIRSFLAHALYCQLVPYKREIKGSFALSLSADPNHVLQVTFFPPCETRVLLEKVKIKRIPLSTCRTLIPQYGVH